MFNPSHKKKNSQMSPRDIVAIVRCLHHLATFLDKKTKWTFPTPMNHHHYPEWLMQGMFGPWLQPYHLHVPAGQVPQTSRHFSFGLRPTSNTNFNVWSFTFLHTHVCQEYCLLLSLDWRRSDPSTLRASAHPKCLPFCFSHHSRGNSRISSLGVVVPNVNVIYRQILLLIPFLRKQKIEYAACKTIQPFLFISIDSNFILFM